MTADVTSAASSNGRAPGSATAREWHRDPMRLALDGSAAFPQHGPPEPYCLDVGRRILTAQLGFSSWVLRRVESVSFEEGRSVARTMTIHFTVPEDAPVFVAPDGPGGEPRRLWLVPLALMNRRTLVDFHLRDEEDRPLTMPGLRLAQRLDESLLLAAAAASVDLTEPVERFVREVVAAPRAEVLSAIREFGEGARGDELRRLRDSSALFRMVLARLRHNFTLYTLLPVDQGRERLLRMSFVEPVTWRYQQPRLEPEDGVWTYTPWQRAPRLSHLSAALGWAPTRIRFQTPSAENAASYHFEVAAPKGVRITEATLLAGRPHVPAERVTVDHVRADSLTIGLHGVEVPPNSLCRAQVDLRVQRAGWLTTLLLATVAIFLVMCSVLSHALTQDAVDPGQDTNVIVLLITTAAAVATFVAQRDTPGVAARLVTGMRTIGVLAMAVPLVGAGFLSYKEVDPPLPPLEQVPGPADPSTRIGLTALTIVAAVLLAVVAVAWVRTWRDERRDTETSPWDMTVRTRQVEEPELPTDYRLALERFGFGAPAVGVRSSEGWHHTYCWTDADHTDALVALDHLRSRSPGYACAHPGSCPRAKANGCAIPVPRKEDAGATRAQGGSVGRQAVRASSASAASACSKHSRGG